MAAMSRTGPRSSPDLDPADGTSSLGLDAVAVGDATPKTAPSLMNSFPEVDPVRMVVPLLWAATGMILLLLAIVVLLSAFLCRRRRRHRHLRHVRRVISGANKVTNCFPQILNVNNNNGVASCYGKNRMAGFHDHNGIACFHGDVALEPLTGADADADADADPDTDAANHVTENAENSWRETGLDGDAVCRVTPHDLQIVSQI